MEVKVKNPFSLLGRSKISFRFDVHAYFLAAELNGKEIHELEDFSESHLVMSWIYGAYVSSCWRRNKPVKYSYDYISKLYRYYYVNDYKVVHELKTTMVQSKVLGKSIQQWAETAGAEKKK